MRVSLTVCSNGFSDRNPGGQVAFGQGWEEILGSRASSMLAAIGQTQQMQQGTSGKADFVHEEWCFFLLPAHVAAATALNQSVPKWMWFASS